MKMKIFGNIIRAVRGVKNCLCGGVTKALVATTAVMFAFAAWAGMYTDSSGNEWNYTIYSGKAIINSVVGTDPDEGRCVGDIEIPPTLEGYPVTVIGDDVFWEHSAMTSVVIPDSVTTIGSSAFYECSALKHVTIPDSVTSIGSFAFNGLSELVSVTISENLVALGQYSFAYCPKLTGVTIPDGVTAIYKGAFAYCESLDDVTVPESVTVLEGDAFKGCTSLKSVRLPEGFVAFSVMTDYFSGCSEELEISSVEKVGSLTWHFKVVDGGAEICYNDEDDEATINPSMALGAIEIPQTLGLGGFPVTSIGEEAFMDCNKLTSVTIPSTVTRIGEDAFRDCSSMALTVPDTVVSIGDGAFAGCDAMADNGFVIVRGVLHHYTDKDDNVSIPDGVTRIGRSAFAECDIDSVTIPSSVTNIGAYAFRECKNLETIDVPASVTMIEQGTFWKCDALRDVTIPKSVTSVRVDAFTDTALATVHVEKGDTKRVKELIADSGYDVSKVTFVEPPDVFTVTFNANCGSVTPGTCIVPKDAAVGTLPEPTRDGFTFDGWFTEGGVQVSADTIVAGDVTFYAHWTEIVDVAAIWYTTRAEAFAEARRTGKKVFMICGRDTCGNTMYTKNVACEDPMVKPTLVAKCVLWYTNCDTQEDENSYYWPNGSFALPVVCVIDPANEYGYIVRVTGLQWPGNIASLLTHVPDPVAPDSAIDPETIDPSNPGDLPWYKVINARDIWDPVRVSKAETLRGALYYGAEVMGIVELKLGKLSRNRTSKVSGTVTTLDGKKHKIKADTLSVDSTYAGSLNLEVSGLGGMDLAVGSIGGVNVFAGSLGKWHVQSANVGGNWTKANATAVVAVGDVSAFGSGVLTDLLPTNEVAAVASGKWTFKKAASVKWAKPKADQATFTPLDAKGKGLIIDTSKDKTNFSGLKLTYTPKKGTFKGSFKVYAVQAGKVKKFTINANGVVVDGVGYGSATCKCPAITWSVTVE